MSSQVCVDAAEAGSSSAIAALASASFTYFLSKPPLPSGMSSHWNSCFVLSAIIVNSFYLFVFKIGRGEEDKPLVPLSERKLTAYDTVTVPSVPVKV